MNKLCSFKGMNNFVRASRWMSAVSDNFSDNSYMAIETLKEKRKVRTVDLIAMKEVGKKIKCLTCYDYTFAALLNRTKLDVVLVGDSAGHVMQGKSNTLSVTMQHMKYHVTCVAPAIKRPLLVADMPFMAAGPSLKVTAFNAAELMAVGAEALKIEGANQKILEQIEFLVLSGVPVMGHIGMQPQSLNVYGGFKIMGKNEKAAERLVHEAKDLENAGCFALVLELTQPQVAVTVSKSVKIPVIGIGSGNNCDGNILVLQDMLGMNPLFKPKFLKHFGSIGNSVIDAVDKYIDEVEKGVSEPV